MFTVNGSLEPASWFKLNVVSEVDKIADNYIAEYRNNECQTKSKEELMKRIEHLRDMGRNLFRNKEMYRAHFMFLHAFMISEYVVDIPLDLLTTLQTNIGICSLKLDDPFVAFPFLKSALLCDIDNVKAKYHLITSMYMLYNLDDALVLINSGLEMNPISEELQTLKKKLLKNKIHEKFSKQIIEQRVNRYKPDLPSGPDPKINISVLLRSITTNRKDSVKEALKVMNEINSLTKLFLQDKRYNELNQLLIDKYYIISLLQHKLNQEVDSIELFKLYRDRATCFYYMENFDKALKCCQNAHKYQPNTIEVLNMEAKTLFKLNLLNKALEIINKSISMVQPNSVEALICEEILFEITFKQEMQNIETSNIKEKSSQVGSDCTAKTEDVKTIEQTRKNPESKKEDSLSKKANETKVTTKDENQVSITNEDEYLLKLCKLCGVMVSGSLDKHARGKEHVKLLKDKEFNKEKPSMMDATTQTSELESFPFMTLFRDLQQQNMQFMF